MVEDSCMDDRHVISQGGKGSLTPVQSSLLTGQAEVKESPERKDFLPISAQGCFG